MTAFEFEPAERFTAGAVGEPGRRTFFIQAAGAGALVTVLAEKEQVGALAATLARLLEMLPEVDDEGIRPSPDDLDLVEPLLAEWRAGSMALDYDAEADRIVVIVTEATVDDEADEDESATAGSSLRVTITRAQARALAEHAGAVVASGRPQCRICGLPMDSEDHVCPAMNGHRKQDV